MSVKLETYRPQKTLLQLHLAATLLGTWAVCTPSTVSWLREMMLTIMMAVIMLVVFARAVLSFG